MGLPTAFSEIDTSDVQILHQFVAKPTESKNHCQFYHNESPIQDEDNHFVITGNLFFY